MTLRKNECNSEEPTTASTILFDHSGIPMQNFIWSEEEEPHKERRRRIMKTHPEVTKLMGVEPLTKYIVIGLVLIHFTTAICLRHHVGTFPWFLATYLIGSTMTHSLFLATHEILHNLAFRNTTLSKLFAIFTQLPIPIAYVISFREYHFEHHKQQGDEAVDTDLPTAWEAHFFRGPILKFLFLCSILFSYTLRPLLVKPKSFTPWHLFNWICVLGVHGLLLKAFGWGVLMYLVTSILMSSLHPSAGHFLSEHMVFQGKFETYSYYGWLNLLTFNVGYHNEHHDFPGVPWSRLPALKAMCPEFYDNIPCHDSWSKVMINFVTMSNVSLYNRMKRKSKQM